MGSAGRSELPSVTSMAAHAQGITRYECTFAGAGSHVQGRLSWRVALRHFRSCRIEDVADMHVSASRTNGARQIWPPYLESASVSDTSSCGVVALIQVCATGWFMH